MDNNDQELEIATIMGITVIIIAIATIVVMEANRIIHKRKTI